MTDIREQIECIRRGERDCLSRIDEFGDTLEKLNAVCEAAHKHIDKDDHYSRLDLESALAALDQT